MIKSGFFKSMNGDRKYGADDMNKPLNLLLSNGVIPVPSSSLQIFVNDKSELYVAPGMAMLEGHWLQNTGNELLGSMESDYVYDRIDAVVLRSDENEDVRNMYIYIKKGYPNTSPSAPLMENTDYIKELCLAQIYIGKRTETISQSAITDTRADTELCGWVTSLIEQVDTSTLFAQWQTAYQEQHEKFDREFYAWFNPTIKDIEKLKDDTQRRLNDMESDTDIALAEMEQKTREIINGITDQCGEDLEALRTIAENNLNQLKTETDIDLQNMQSKITKLQTEAEETQRQAAAQVAATAEQQKKVADAITNMDARAAAGEFNGKDGKDGIVMDLQGLLEGAFIADDGYLCVIAPDGVAVPYHIDSEGYLCMTVKEESDVTSS